MHVSFHSVTILQWYRFPVGAKIAFFFISNWILHHKHSRGGHLFFRIVYEIDFWVLHPERSGCFLWASQVYELFLSALICIQLYTSKSLYLFREETKTNWMQHTYEKQQRQCVIWCTQFVEKPQDIHILHFCMFF